MLSLSSSLQVRRRLSPVRYAPADVKHMERKWWETRFNPRGLSGRDARHNAFGAHVGGLHTSHIWHEVVSCSSAAYKPSITDIGHQRKTRVYLETACGRADMGQSSPICCRPDISLREWLIIVPWSQAHKSETLQLNIFFFSPNSPLSWHFGFSRVGNRCYRVLQHLALHRLVSVDKLGQIFTVNLLHGNKISVFTWIQIVLSSNALLDPFFVFWTFVWIK